MTRNVRNDVEQSKVKRRCVVAKEKVLVLGLVLVLLSVMCKIILAHFWSEKSIIELKGRFGITIDAGGSGTRLSIYEYTKDNQLKRIAFVKCEGSGMSASDAATFSKKLKNCLDTIEEKIPNEVQSKTPLYFAATAGMRLLSLQNKTTYNNLWNVTRKVLEHTAYKIKMAATLKPKLEAAYSWTTVNSLLNREKSSGVLEVGSTSIQIAFEPNTDHNTLPNEYRETVVLGSKSYNIYVHSYLCLGIEQFIKRHRAVLIKRSGFVSDVQDPCSATGFSHTFTASEIWNSVCVSGSYAEDVLGESLEDDAGNANYTIHGASNFTACYNHVRHMFQTVCSYASCGVNNVYQPLAQGLFLGIGGGVFYASKFLELSDQVGLIAYRNATKNLCTLNYTQLSSMKDFDKYAINYCLADVYAFFLMSDLLKLKNLTDGVSFTNKINGKPLKWTRGLLLNKLNELSPPIITKMTSFPLTLFVILLIVTSISLLLGIVLIVRAMNFCVTVNKGLRLEITSIQSLE